MRFLRFIQKKNVITSVIKCYKSKEVEKKKHLHVSFARTLTLSETYSKNTHTSIRAELSLLEGSNCFQNIFEFWPLLCSSHSALHLRTVIVCRPSSHRVSFVNLALSASTAAVALVIRLWETYIIALFKI